MLDFILQALKASPGRLLLLLLALALELSFLSGLPYSFRYIVDMGILAGRDDVLRMIFTALLLGAVVFMVVGTFRDQLLARWIAISMHQLRMTMMLRVQASKESWFASRKRSDLMARFSSDSAGVEQALNVMVPWAVLPGLEVIVNTLLLFTLDWHLAVLGLLVFPAALLGPRLLGAWASSSALVRRNQESQTLVVLDEQLASFRVARAVGLQARQRARYQDESERLLTRAATQGLAAALVERFANSAVLLLNVVILAYGCWLVRQGSLSVGELAAFQSLFLSLSWALSYLAQYLPMWYSGQSAFVRINEVLKASLLANGGKRDVPALQSSIVFDQVSFVYPGAPEGSKPGSATEAKEVLSKLDLELMRGSSVALVGGSGSGKSTVISLLLGFEQPSHGRVLIDSAPLSALNLEQWRGQIGVVFQDTFIFNASVAENLRVAKLDASQSELEQAAKLAGLHHVIVDLPKGYASQLGEGRISLSGGQRQRLGIARALLRKPEVLILDEPTSALDIATEQQLQKTLEQICTNRTSLWVTHRLEQAARCDYIMVLEQGQILEAGSHQALLDYQGRYASLWRKQAGFSFQGASAKISVERLDQISLFSGLGEAILQRIAESFASQTAHAGELLVQQGDVGDRFFMIARGMVEVYRVGDSGAEQSLAILSDGDSFGEIALLAERPRTANVRAMLETTLLSLSKAQLDNLIEQAPSLGTRMRVTAIERLKGQT